MISKACVVGSYQKKMEELAAYPDVDLTVLVPPSWRDERGTLVLERAHTRGYELAVRPLALNGHFHLHFFPGLRRFVAERRPDIVHIDEEPYNLATWQAVRAAERAGAHVVFFTWQNLRRSYPPPFSWMEGYVLAHADHAIAGNQEAVRVWRAKGYSGPITVIPQFGVDPDIYTYREPRARFEGPFSIGYVGRLIHDKGIDVLLRAAAGLSGEWRLCLLGSGPHEKALRRTAGALGIAPRVTFLAPLPSTEIPRFMHTLDVLVLPSRTRPNWKEQFGRVLVEAMSCGVPVIGSDSGEIPSVLGGAGLVFPEEDVEALRAHLTRLRDDPDLRVGLSAAGRARVMAHYTQARIAAATREVYLQMMGAAPRA